jgi:hypothetical protein
MPTLITDHNEVVTAKTSIEIPYVKLDTYCNAAGLHANSDAELSMKTLCAFNLGLELLEHILEGERCWLVYPGREPEPYEMPRVEYKQLWGTHSFTFHVGQRFGDRMAYCVRQVLGLQTADDGIASMMAHYLLLPTIKPQNGCIYTGEKPH